MMTANAMSIKMGQTVMLSVDNGGFKIKVKILDVRHAWGRVDYYITPIEGEGEKWVSESRISAAPLEK